MEFFFIYFYFFIFLSSSLYSNFRSLEILIRLRPPFRIVFFRFCLKSTFIFVQKKKKKKTKTELKVRDVVTCGRSHVSGADHVSGTFYFMCMLSSPRPFPVPFFMSDLCLSLYVRVNQCRWCPCLNKTFLKLKRVKACSAISKHATPVRFWLPNVTYTVTPNLYFNCSPPPCMVFGNNELLSKLLL